MTVTLPVGEDTVELDVQELAVIAEGMFKEFGIAGVQSILAKHGMKLEEGVEQTELEIASVSVDDWEPDDTDEDLTPDPDRSGPNPN